MKNTGTNSLDSSRKPILTCINENKGKVSKLRLSKLLTHRSKDSNIQLKSEQKEAKKTRLAHKTPRNIVYHSNADFNVYNL